jgi:hypothetical protein
VSSSGWNLHRVVQEGEWPPFWFGLGAGGGGEGGIR